MKLPKEHLNAEIKKLPRPIESDTEWSAVWMDGELYVRLQWTDGFEALASLGPEASALAQAHQETRH